MLVHSVETDLANGFRYINLVSGMLKDNLPGVVTKEELMNHYLHGMKAKGNMDFNVTVVNLVQAANLAGVKVKGQSKLEINVSMLDQWKYINDNVKATQGKLSRKAIRERLYKNKDDIVKTYEGGATIKELASAWNVNTTTMHRYLTEFGANMRSGGKRKLLDEIATTYKHDKIGKRRRERYVK